MASVGDYLRELRQRRGLSLEEMSRATRVASRYLECLESDRFSALPAPVFTRGFIRAYCQAVGEPPDEALARYESRDGAAPPPPRPTPAAGPPPAWLPDVQAAMGGVASPYRLVARVSEATWIRVRTEDGRNIEETVPAGQVREWVSNRPFVLTLGNAGGVTLELNGRTLPPLGPSGAVISRIVLPPQ